MIILDDLINDVKDAVGVTQPNEADRRIKLYIKLTVFDLNDSFKSLLYKSATVATDSNGNFTFPDDVRRILAVYNGAQELRPVSNKSFRRHDQATLGRPIVAAYQEGGRLKGSMYPGSAVDLEVNYVESSGDVKNIPDRYYEALLAGAAMRYSLWKEREDPKVSGRLEQYYEKMRIKLNIEQNRLIKSVPQLKFPDEQSWERAFAAHGASLTATVTTS